MTDSYLQSGILNYRYNRNQLAKVFADMTDNMIRTHRLNRSELLYLIEKISGRPAHEFLATEKKVNIYVELNKKARKPDLNLPNWLK